MSNQNDYSEYNDLVFPKDTELGQLRIFEVYQFFDIPMCFSSINNMGHYFLSTLYDLSDRKKPEWLLLPLSEKRFYEVRAGYISLKQAFLNSETNYVYFINSQRLVKKRLPDIDSNIFPIDGVRFNYSTYRNIIHVDSTEEYSNSILKEVLDIGFENTKYSKPVFPIDHLGRYLVLIQDLVGSLSLKKDLNNKKYYLRKSRDEETELGLVGTYAASFSVRLVSMDIRGILFDDKKITTNICRLIEMIERCNDQDSLQIFFSEFHQRTILKFISLLKMLSHSKTDIKMHAAFPYKSSKHTKLKHTHIGPVVQILEQIIEETPIEYEIEGLLVGLVTLNRTFNILSDEEGEENYISGTVLDSHLNDAGYATINNRYKFKIRETETFNPVVGETKKKYFLLGIGNTSIQ